MRHFTSVSIPSIVTYDINCEYAVAVDAVLQDAVIKFARVLGISPKLLQKACTKYLVDGVVLTDLPLTPLKVEAVVKFVMFISDLIRMEKADIFNGMRTSTTFTHANLDSGDVFTWVHMVA